MATKSGGGGGGGRRIIKILIFGWFFERIGLDRLSRFPRSRCIYIFSEKNSFSRFDKFDREKKQWILLASKENKIKWETNYIFLLVQNNN